MTLTKGLIAFFIISIIIFIHGLKTDRIGKQLEAIKVLEGIRTEDLSSIPDADAAFRLWLEKNDKSSYDQHMSMRKLLTYFLEKNGFADVTEDKVDGELRFDLTSYEVAVDIKPTTSYSRQKSIVSYLAYVKSYNTNRIRFYYVTQIDTSTLHNKVDSALAVLKSRHGILKEEGKVHGDYINKVLSVGMGYGNNLDISVYAATSGQRATESIYMRVGIDSVDLPTVKEIAPSKADLPNEEEIRTLTSMSDSYPDLTVSTVEDLLSKEYSAAYQDVELLGFDFSRSLFPFFLILFLLLISLAFVDWIKRADKEKAKIFDKDLLEDVFEPVSNIKIIRLFVMVVMPALSIYLSLPPIKSLTGLSLGLIIALGLAVTITNFYCFNKTKSQ